MTSVASIRLFQVALKLKVHPNREQAALERKKGYNAVLLIFPILKTEICFILLKNTKAQPKFC